MDRIDLHIEVPAVKLSELSNRTKGESSEKIRNRVIAARIIQEERFKTYPGIYFNAQMTAKLIELYCEIDHHGQQLLKMAMEKLGFSGRSYARILKVARTIADLANSHQIKPDHIAEAIQYRSMDRNGFMK